MSKMLKRTPMRYYYPVLCEWFEIIFFSPLRGISSNATHVFLVQYPKNSTQTLAVDNLRPKTLRGIKPAFVTPKKYDEQPNLFVHGTVPQKIF